MIATLLAVLQLTRLNLPVGSLLLMWPTITALWIANNGMPTFELLLIFVAGTVLMRSAGCVINDIADREIDRQVKRTFNRPLAEGRLSVATAWLVFAVLTILAVSLVWRLNRETQILAVLGFVVAVVYPFVKRVSMLPQFVLGIAFSWGIPMTVTAVTGSFSYEWAIVVLFIANFCWIVAYDTLYAMVDRDDDRLLNVGSTALLLGDRVAPVIACLNSLTLILWTMMGLMLDLTRLFYVAMIVVAGLFVFQTIQAYKPDNRAGWFVAFKSNIWSGTALFFGVMLSLPSASI